MRDDTHAINLMLCLYVIPILCFHTKGQFQKRIESLERLLAEERQKVQAAEKKLQMHDDI